MLLNNHLPVSSNTQHFLAVRPYAVYTVGSALGTVGKTPQWTATSHVRVPEQCQLPVTPGPGGRQAMAPMLAPQPARARLSSRTGLLASARLSFGHGRHLGSEAADGESVSIPSQLKVKSFSKTESILTLNLFFHVSKYLVSIHISNWPD